MIEKYQGLIYKVVYSVVGPQLDKAEVDDIVQDVNIRLLGNAMSQYDATKGELSTFIHAVAKNLTIDAMRERQREMAHRQSNGFVTGSAEDSEDREYVDQGPDTYADQGFDQLEQLIRLEQEQRLTNAIKQLSPKERLFLKLVLSDDFDAESYAEKMGVAPITIRVRKSRIAEKLRDIIKTANQD